MGLKLSVQVVTGDKDLSWLQKQCEWDHLVTAPRVRRDPRSSLKEGQFKDLVAGMSVWLSQKHLPSA